MQNTQPKKEVDGDEVSLNVASANKKNMNSLPRLGFIPWIIWVAFNDLRVPEVWGREWRPVAGPVLGALVHQLRHLELKLISVRIKISRLAGNIAKRRTAA